MLFDKITIGNITLKNRLVMPALDLGYCPDGVVNDRLINFYQKRAQGGAGLIMIGGTAIEAQEVWGGFVSIHDDSLIAGHRKLVTTLKEYGAHTGIQLFHAGRYSYAFTNGYDIKAPSPLMSPLSRQIPRELSIPEIHEIIKLFGQAALRAQQAGYDVIEVISSAGYLINQFYSPATNKRTDEYGGSLEKRMRFGLEVIKEIRRQVGDDMVLSIRLSGSDFIPEGNTWREMVQFAKELEKASLNMINVTGGWHESRIPQIQAEVPRAAYTYLAAKIKRAVTIPVVASNRINNPATAEQVLKQGKADLISIGRSFIADPEWAVKAQTGRADTIRRCIACMECLNTLFEYSTGKGVLCAINPQAGLEGERIITKTSSPLKILVIGGGPAGLETARTAALKGHKVTLVEKNSQIGGQWNIAAIPPGKSEFISLLNYYENILPSLGVEIRLNTVAHSALVNHLNPDKIVVATGAVPTSPSFPLADEANVVRAWDVLKEAALLKGPEIVVIGGGSVGCETALHIAEQGTLDAETLKFLMLHQVESPETLYDMLTTGSYKVSLVEIGPSLASDMGRGTRWTVLKHLKTMGINLMTESKVKAVTVHGVKIEQNNKEILLPADTIVLATGSSPDLSLYEELKQMFREIYLVGDALQPAKVIDAIHQAFVVASEL